MLKVTMNYRSSNPVKIVFPIESVDREVRSGERILLTDERTPVSLGRIISTYRMARSRQLAWVEWN